MAAVAIEAGDEVCTPFGSVSFRLAFFAASSDLGESTGAAAAAGVGVPRAEGGFLSSDFGESAAGGAAAAAVAVGMGAQPRAEEDADVDALFLCFFSYIIVISQYSTCLSEHTYMHTQVHKHASTLA